jgi:hypothetical protein
MTTERKIDRIPEGDLPSLPDGWEWVSNLSGECPRSGGCVPCWDIQGPRGRDAWVDTAESIESDGAPAEIVALVKYANGLGPDPRATTPPTRDNRALAIAMLAAVMDDNEDPRIEAANALLENA